jgi:hypothetical protein
MLSTATKSRPRRFQDESDTEDLRQQLVDLLAGLDAGQLQKLVQFITSDSFADENDSGLESSAPGPNDTSASGATPAGASPFSAKARPATSSFCEREYITDTGARERQTIAVSKHADNPEVDKCLAYIWQNRAIFPDQERACDTVRTAFATGHLKTAADFIGRGR